MTMAVMGQLSVSQAPNSHSQGFTVVLVTSRLPHMTSIGKELRGSPVDQRPKIEVCRTPGPHPDL